MSQKIDFTIPFNSLVQYVPQNLRNEVIKGLISNLFDRFMTHDESIPLYGYIGRKPVSSDDRTVKIPQATVERDINAIVPVLNFTLGTEKYAFTVQDLINKATVLGVDSSNQRWLYSQANNYLPPIDIDRFSNFYNYYWIANAVASKPTLSWNPELLPEYYTISSPKPSDSDKLNVLVATTRPIILTGAGFEDQTFTIKFSSPTEFVITANAGLGAWVPTSVSVTLTSDSQHVKFDVTDGVSTETLVEFDVVRETVYDADGNAVGTQDFATNDEYLLDTAFLSRNYVLSTVALTPSTYGKGNFKNILALSKYQTIDGVQVGNGDRVLVQTNGPDDGIYIVGPGAWTRAEDYDGLTMKPMARVWVKDGIQNKGLIFVSGFGNSWSTDGVVVESNTNDWQEGNYWVHSSALESYNLSRAEVVQAVRPIIEYNSDIRLNSFAKDGLPSTSGFEFKQKKTEFNQLPMFDLFRYDGTHSGLVSAIFYYVEDLTQELDLDLQKRVKLSTGASSDYVFNHGCADANGDMLFFSKSDALSSIWHAGYTSSVVIDQVFISALEMAAGEVKGTLSNLVANDFVQQQVWTLTATSETTFKVSGSKTLNIPDAYKTITVGVPYANIDFSCLIEAGATPFGAGDTFVFRIGALETPRYVYRDSDEVISDVYGGKIADTANVGAYQVPRPFIFNPYNSARDEVAEGTLYSHFRSIIQNQPSTSLSDFAFGGSIKNWSEQHTLLASLLMQRDLTPISMIDLAQRQYETALSTLGDTYQATIADYFSSVGVIALDGSAAQEAKLNALLDYLLTIRASDNDVRTVLYDTTSAVTGFPITLPQLGILPLVVPTIAFDNVLGQDLIVHHDGHNSPLYVDDVSFRRAVLNNSADTLVERSDGTSTPAVGSFTYDVPVKPYKGTLWIRPNGDDRDMLAFDVDFDSTPLSATVGQTWYDRPSDTLSIWNGVSWDAQPTPLVAWKFVNLANTLNQLIILAETRLYNGINPNSRKVQFDDLINVPEFRTQLERELFTFAANNGLAPLGSNYVASDSFTWNFSSASLADFPALSTATVPARWMNIIKAHHATFGSLVVPTERPNLEPWKLLGFTTYAAWWASLTSGQQASFAPIDNLANLTQASYTNLGSVKAILTPYSATAPQGLQIVDGIQLSDGDLVLLQNEVGPENNGIWLVRSGAWTRPQTTMLAKSYVTVESGVENAQTIWVLQNDVTVGVDAQVYSQARRWGSSLWSYIKTQRPGLRLSVDTVRDSLLPPYVNSTLTQSVNALTTVMPSGLANDYVFGDGGPVESAWLSTIDFGYSMARALFRHDPLMFLGFCWGFNWVEVANVLFDGYDINTPGHKRFRLHGDLNRVITRGSENKIIGDGSAYTIIYDAYEVDNTGRYQNFSVRNSDGIAVAYVREGAPYTVGGLQIEIEDNGQPFHIGDKFTVTADGTVSFIPALRYQYLGFGQVFTNALRQMSIDTQDSFAIDAFRNWDVNMGHRAGGLVATDDLKVRTDSDSLSTSSYELIFKKNEISKDTWLQAMRITVLQFGGRKELDSGFAPLADGRDWVFRIEGYNPRYSNITYYDLTTAGDNVTFQALGGEKTPIQWLQPTLSSGLTTSYLPLTITGVQNVVNFLFGYKKYVEEQGWNFNRIGSENNIDYRTGRSRTWQLEIEKFIDQCYRGIQVDQGHIVNPFSDEVWLTQNTGLLAEFKDTALFDITGHAAVFDIAGIKMKAEDIHAVRGNESSTIRAVAPMYSIHAQLDEYEHLFVFNNFVEESTQTGVLYDPFSGGRVVTYKFNGRKQASATFRPEFGGHYLVGSEVRQNLQASTDNMASFYDSNKVFENETSSRHALALLGFSTKDYFSDLDISDKTQFNFWRGLIQSKGTNLSVGAYLNNNRFDDAKLDEYWAYKVAEYGDARQNTYPELKLNVDDTLQQFTQLQFDAKPRFVGDTDYKLSNFTQIDRIDESRWFGIDDLDQDAYFKAEVVGTFNRDTIIGEVYTLPFIADKLVAPNLGAGFEPINATTVRATDTTMSVVGYGPATPRYNPIKLFNYVANELIEEIPLWHPAFGQHTPTALEGLNIISTQNPAKYNFSTQVVSNNSYDPLRPWGSNEIGRVWFDTRNLEYVPYWDSVIFTNRTERLSRWGALADFATIDVYEWVKSTVPPSEYNALALAQAGDADLDAATRAAGEVAGQETYVRDRIWSIRPVAWSYSGVPVAGAHPSFNASAGVFDTKLDLSGNGLAVLSAGTFASYGITAGMRIGAFDNSTIAPKPMSESIISSNFTKKVYYGGAALVADSITNAGFIVNVSALGYTSIVGALVFEATDTVTRRADIDGAFIDEWDVSTVLTVSNPDSGEVEAVEVYSAVGTTADVPYHGATVSLTSNAKVIVDLPSTGISVTVSSIAGGVIAVEAVRDAIVASLETQIALRDAVVISDVVSVPPEVPNASALSNDPLDQTDPLVAMYGWAAWNVPTQLQLTNDGRQPNSAWKPYLGDLAVQGQIDIAQVTDAVAYSAAPLTLNDGTIVNRYSTTWTDWSVLKNTVLRKTQVTSGALTLTLDDDYVGDAPSFSNIDSAITSVYVNGITQLKANFDIAGGSLTINENSVAFGSNATVIIRKYEPSAEELAFDPDVADNLTFQQQYKQDYEYVSLPVRDSEGSLSSTIYYFWVKNKTTSAFGKKLSIQSMAQELRDGPSNFLTFQTPTSGMLGSGVTSDPYRYDAIAISGLSYVVSKDDTFKLRFTRNFTLRDDPQQIDLKDTHAEWSLLRPGQRTKIPEALWQKLIDSVAGQDLAGNAVPALRRSLYDERNGTASQFGFGSEQTLAPKDLLVSSITYTIVNTKLIDTTIPIPGPDFISFLNFDESDTWFATPQAARQTMTDIWTTAKPSQINEIFFAALNDILASNYELSDVFKTSRLSAYSIKVVATAPVQPAYE